MLSAYEIELVTKLALEKHSQRSISRITGVSRESVRSILGGKRPDYDAIRREKEREKVVFTETIARCPTCGARVYVPCLACRIRAWMATK
jgi:hypothetical protein